MPLIYEGYIRYSAEARIAAFVVLYLREMGDLKIKADVSKSHGTYKIPGS